MIIFLVKKLNPIEHFQYFYSMKKINYYYIKDQV
jgi:hypothetical protein